MVTFFRSILNTVYTFFVHLYTLVSSATQPPPDTITPYPVDLECGPESQQLEKVSYVAPPRLSPGLPPLDNSSCQRQPGVSSHRCFSSSLLNACENTIRRPCAPQNYFNPQTRPRPQMPLPPLRQFVFPAFPDYIASSQSIHSVVASPVKHVVDRPPSVYSASSASSDVRSQSSSASSKVYATPPTMKKTHRKQSPLIWFKDASGVIGTGSSSSLSSMQSATSSMSTSSLRRPRSGHRNSLQRMKPDPSLSYKRYTARSSSDVRQSQRLVKLSRSPSEDPVSIVRKVFVECGSEVDTEGGGARARLINRETARSFGGMEIVDEEEEEEELLPRPAEKSQEQHACSSRPDTLRTVDEENEGRLFYRPEHVEQSPEPHSPSSCSSTPDSTGPLTPILPLSLSEIIRSSCPVRSEPLMVTTQLPYLNRTSVVLSGLGISLPSDGSFPEVQGPSCTANTMDAEKRVSVVTWSDLVSFSSYGLNTMSQSDTDIPEEEQASILEGYLNEDEQLTTNSLEDSDSGTELAAVLDSMSLLVGRGLDARLLLSPPRQFCYAQAV